MSGHRTRPFESVVGGFVVFLVAVSPVLLIAWAGASGSVGDLSQVEVLPVGLAMAIGLGVFGGFLTGRAFQHVDATPDKNGLDAWAAYVLGLGVFILILTLIPVVVSRMMLPDESQSLDDRLVWIGLVWVVGHVVAAALAALTGRAFLGRRPSTTLDEGRDERQRVSK